MMNWKRTATALAAVVLGASAVNLVMATPASANHSAYQQSTRTIVVQQMTGHVATGYSNVFIAVANYYNGIPGHPFNIVQGSCQLGMACVHEYAENYGATGYDGLTTRANVCGPSSNLCVYSTTSPAGTFTTVQLNTYYLGATGVTTNLTQMSTGCHEWGHMTSLEHSSGATCMQATIDNITHLLNTGSTVDTNEELELYDIYVNGGIPMY